MITVITYGTYDLLHNGHINLLRRAKELGDYLIVGITTDNYDRERGKLNVQNDLIKRIEDVRATGLADRIIVEEYFGQKIDDIQRLKVDIFAIGSDWTGHFDYLNEFCKVVYLDRTKGVSSTQLRMERSKIVNLGVIGSETEAEGFLAEAKYVSGMEVDNIFDSAALAAKKDLQTFAQNLDAVYLCRQAPSCLDLIQTLLESGKHILFESQIRTDPVQLEHLYDFARSRSLVLLEANQTAFCPAFNHFNQVIKSNQIGAIRDISLSHPRLLPSILLPMIKLLGDSILNLHFFTTLSEDGECTLRGVLQYPQAVATFQAGAGAKWDGSLIINGTLGYAYVPDPWWQMESYEFRYQEKRLNEKYFYKLSGNGYRYVIQEFMSMIHTGNLVTNKLLPEETLAACRIMVELQKTLEAQ